MATEPTDRKFNRRFLLEKRLTPSKIARFIGDVSASDWVEVDRFAKRAEAKRYAHDTNPTFFKPGTEYRVRYIHQKVEQA